MKNLKKNQSLHAAQFRLRAQKWEPGQQWPLGSLAGKHLKDAPPALCSCLQRCCGSPHAIPHHTLGPLGHQNDTEVFWVWALWIFSFSFLFIFFFFWLSFPTSLSYFMFSWFLCTEMFKLILNYIYIYIMQIFSLCLPWKLYFTFLTL